MAWFVNHILKYCIILLFQKYVCIILHSCFHSFHCFCAIQNKLQNDVSAQMSEIHRLKGKKCSLEGATSQYHPCVSGIDLWWGMQVTYTTIFVHFLIQSCFFLLHTDVHKSWYPVGWCVLYCGVLDCWSNGACSDVCLNVCTRLQSR